MPPAHWRLILNGKSAGDPHKQLRKLCGLR